MYIEIPFPIPFPTADPTNSKMLHGLHGPNLMAPAKLPMTSSMGAGMVYLPLLMIDVGAEVGMSA